MSYPTEKLPTYHFSSFTEEMAKRTFHLETVIDSDELLREWYSEADRTEITDKEQAELDALRADLELYVRGWNEYELRAKFIYPLVRLVRYDDFYRTVGYFTERKLVAEFQNARLSGIVDGMVARGHFEPRKPIFFLHEYKKEMEASGDAPGQLLAEMVAGRYSLPFPNIDLGIVMEPEPEIDFPSYGCYVIGRLWFFARMEGKSYYISPPHDAGDREDLRRIFRLLKAMKHMIFAAIDRAEGRTV